MNFRQTRQLLARFLNDEGLLPTSELVVDRKEAGRYEIRIRAAPEIQVFPTPPVWRVADYLVGNPALWSLSAIEVEVAPSIVGRIAIFGLSFPQAIEKVRTDGFHKAKFQLLPGTSLPGPGLPATLFALVGYDRREHQTQLQVYQGIDSGDETFLLHALLPTDSNGFTHLDGSTVYLSPADRERMFRHAQKLKAPKKKHFRLDGLVSLHDGYQLARAFFPVEELSLEYFKITSE